MLIRPQVHGPEQARGWVLLGEGGDDFDRRRLADRCGHQRPPARLVRHRRLAAGVPVVYGHRPGAVDVHRVHPRHPGGGVLCATRRHLGVLYGRLVPDGIGLRQGNSLLPVQVLHLLTAPRKYV